MPFEAACHDHIDVHARELSGRLECSDTTTLNVTFRRTSWEAELTLLPIWVTACLIWTWLKKKSAILPQPCACMPQEDSVTCRAHNAHFTYLHEFLQHIDVCCPANCSNGALWGYACNSAWPAPELLRIVLASFANTSMAYLCLRFEARCTCQPSHFVRPQARH